MPGRADTLTEQLAVHLDELGIPVRVREATAWLPVPIALVPIHGAGGQDRVVELAFVPGIESPRLLQLTVGVPQVVQPEALGTTHAFLAHLNLHLLLPGFFFSGREKKLLYRHMLPCPDDSLDMEVISRTLVLAGTMVQTHEPLIAQVVSGQVELGEAIVALDALLKGEA